MTGGVIRFDNMSAVDRTLYYQCREYIKLCLIVEDLQCFREVDGSFTYQKLIDEIIFKANVLLREFEASLKRLKNDRKMVGKRSSGERMSET